MSLRAPRGRSDSKHLCQRGGATAAPGLSPRQGTQGGRAAEGIHSRSPAGAEKAPGSREDAGHSSGEGSAGRAAGAAHGSGAGPAPERGRAALGALEDADALGDVLAAQGTRVQPLAAAPAAADVATGQENHLGLGERQRGGTESAAAPEPRSRHGGAGDHPRVSAWGQSPAPRPISVPPGCAWAVPSRSAMGRGAGHGG